MNKVLIIVCFIISAYSSYAQIRDTSFRPIIKKHIKHPIKWGKIDVWYMSVIISDSGFVNIKEFRKHQDTSKWEYPAITDSLKVIEGLLGIIVNDNKVSRAAYNKTDSAWKVANRWANIFRVFCLKNNITEEDVINMIRKQCFTSVNLYNKHNKKRKT